MKRYLPAIIILIFVCWIFGFVFLAVTGTARPQIAKTAPTIAFAKPATDPWLTKDAAGFFAFIAVLVASGQALLVVIQLKLFRESLVPTRLAAEAAKKSADHIPTVERAYLYIKSVKCQTLTGALAPGEDGLVKLVVSFSLQNHGRTPAIVQFTDFDLRLCLPSQLPQLTTRGNPLPTPFIVGSGLEYGPHDATLRLPASEVERIQGGLTRFYFAGLFGSADIFGQPHEVSVCTYWDHHQRRFVLPPDGRGNFTT
ncbi:hypothetical protein AB8A20_07975 [Tardiphaga sp. 604_B6_N1_1]|uniref:hypothetical protein n=1 Tax=unclassified Tardiphaga TaxID=2631404 RepID=UPI003F263691